MLIRLTTLIAVAALITHALWPLERLSIYGIVIAVAIPLFWVRGEGSKRSPETSHPLQDNVVQLDDYRRRKSAEKKKGEGQKKL